MNHPLYLHHQDRYWLKDVQFALGVVVAVGGAAVVLSEVIHLFV